MADACNEGHADRATVFEVQRRLNFNFGGR